MLDRSAAIFCICTHLLSANDRLARAAANKSESQPLSAFLATGIALIACSIQQTRLTSFDQHSRRDHLLSLFIVATPDIQVCKIGYAPTHAIFGNK